MIKDCAPGRPIVRLKLTTDGQEASRVLCDSGATCPTIRCCTRVNVRVGSGKEVFVWKRFNL